MTSDPDNISRDASLNETGGNAGSNNANGVSPSSDAVDPNRFGDGSTSPRSSDDIITRPFESKPSAGGDVFEGASTTETLDFADNWGESLYDSEPNGSETDPDLPKDDELTVISKSSSEGDSDVDEFGLLKPGSKFGQFVIVRYVGGGGMGRVYEGEDRDLERKVAIKVLPRRRAQDDGVVARFLNEAKSAARLNHENIAQVYLYGNVDGAPYIAFEYVEGVNLRDYVRENGALELNEAVDYTLQTAAALAHAAAHGVTHRDVKPSNIIVTPQKRVKLIDMGLARLLKPQIDDDLTESGVTLGTFDYISPEQARDPRLADVRSDVYSLGCTFYYMLTGSPPYPEGTMLQKLLQHQGDEVPDAREANRNVPAEISAVVKKMMKKNPDERYQTPDALIFDLVEIADILGLRVSSRGRVESSPSVVGSVALRPWRLPGVAAIVFFALFMWWYAFFLKGKELSLPKVEPFAPPTQVATEDESTRLSTDAGSSDGSASPSDFSTNFPSTTGGSGAELDAYDLDELYSFNVSRLSDRLLGGNLEDGSDWRRAYLGTSASIAESKRFAYGWRARGSGAGRVATSYSCAPSPAENVSYSFCAYSALGTSGDSDLSGVSVVRVVDRIGKAPNSFASLQAALANASSRESREGTSTGDGSKPVRIELKFSESVLIPSLTFDNIDAEIYAADGYYPVLKFEPSETAIGTGGESMFSLNSSNITFQGTTIEFAVPSQDAVSSEEWSIFKSVGSSRLTLRNSILTAKNMAGETYSSPMHSNVAIFRSESSSEIDESGAIEPFAIRLKNVAICGETGLLVAERPGASIEANDCYFNLSGSAVFYSARTETRPRSDSDDFASDLNLGLNSDGTSSRAKVSDLASDFSLEGLENGTEKDASSFSLNFDGSVFIGRTCFVRLDAEDVEELPAFSVSLTNSIARLDGQALALVVFPRSFDETVFADQWKLDGSLALDVSAFYRFRTERAEPYREIPFSSELDLLERASLSELTVNGAARIDSTPPHKFAVSDFLTCLIQPVDSSATVSGSARATAEALKNKFVDPLDKNNY